jgi:hypothetical protein
MKNEFVKIYLEYIMIKYGINKVILTRLSKMPTDIIEMIVEHTATHNLNAAIYYHEYLFDTIKTRLYSKFNIRSIKENHLDLNNTVICIVMLYLTDNQKQLLIEVKNYPLILLGNSKIK